jgi:hypothetical protein
MTATLVSRPGYTLDVLYLISLALFAVLVVGAVTLVHPIVFGTSFAAVVVAQAATFVMRPVWRFEFDGDRSHSIELVAYRPGWSPIDKYVVRVDGEERARVRGRFKSVDRVEFELGDEATPRATIAVHSFRRRTMRLFAATVEIDGETVFEE